MTNTLFLEKYIFSSFPFGNLLNILFGFFFFRIMINVHIIGILSHSYFPLVNQPLARNSLFAVTTLYHKLLTAVQVCPLLLSKCHLQRIL